MKESLLTILRNKNTTKEEFRLATTKLSKIIAAEAALKIKQKTVSIETIHAHTTGFKISQSICLVPILRSGIALLPSFLYYFDSAPIGILGIRRDEETYEPNMYYHNMPPIDANTFIMILDPMIATGGTICLTVKYLLNRGANESNINVWSIISSLQGVKLIQDNYKDVTINTVAIDEKLNKKKCIVPGLGDFGDRYFGT